MFISLEWERIALDNQTVFDNQSLFLSLLPALALTFHFATLACRMHQRRFCHSYHQLLVTADGVRPFAESAHCILQGADFSLPSTNIPTCIGARHTL